MQKDDMSFSNYLYPILFSTVLASVLCAVFLALISFVGTKVDLPLSSLSFIMSALAGICVFISVFFTARKVRKKGLFLGLCVGLLFFTVMLLTSAATQPMGIGSECFFKFIASVLGGILGGVLGVNSKQKSLPL